MTNQRWGPGRRKSHSTVTQGPTAEIKKFRHPHSGIRNEFGTLSDGRNQCKVFLELGSGRGPSRSTAVSVQTTVLGPGAEASFLGSVASALLQGTDHPRGSAVGETPASLQIDDHTERARELLEVKQCSEVSCTQQRTHCALGTVADAAWRND